MTAPLVIAKHQTTDIALLPALANRHGLITGATGTGKTVTLQTLAEKFSKIGVPVFMADVKGDLTGISQAGAIGEKMAAVLKERHLEMPESQACPVTLWDVFGEQGHPVRATVSDMGPLLLGRMLNLNETQAGVLNLVFKIADDNGLLLLDLKDLRAMLQHVGDNAKQFTTEYGNISAASVGAIARRPRRVPRPRVIASHNSLPMKNRNSAISPPGSKPNTSTAATTNSVKSSREPVRAICQSSQGKRRRPAISISTTKMPTPPMVFANSIARLAPAASAAAAGARDQPAARKLTCRRSYRWRSSRSLRRVRCGARCSGRTPVGRGDS